MPWLTHAIWDFSASGWIVHAEPISCSSLAVRSEFAKVGNRAHDNASAARWNGWVYCEVFHHTKFIKDGSSQLVLRVCHVLSESMTFMLMTTVVAPSTNSSGITP